MSHDAENRDKSKNGLVRSIDALFDQDPTSDEEVVWEEAAAESVEGDPDAFQAALDTFIESPPLKREGLARELRSQAQILRDGNRVDALADGVERLTLETGLPPDEAAVAMARHLLSPGVTSRIVARLGSARDEGRRGELVRVCTLIGHEMALAVSDALSNTTDRFARRTFLDAMQALGSDAMPVLESMMEDGRWYVVRNAVSVLGEVDDTQAVEHITSALGHANPKVRREALLALAKVGGNDAGVLVHGMLEDSDPEVRLAAVMAVGALKVERALKPLLTLLEGEDEDRLVIGLLRALGQLEDPAAVNMIEKRAVGSFFSRPSTEVRIAAYRALHRIGTPRAKSLIEDAMEDKDPEVRAALKNLVD